jgi:hypothetical protein
MPDLRDIDDSILTSISGVSGRYIALGEENPFDGPD